MILSRFPMGGGAELKYASGTTTSTSTITVTGLGFTPVMVYARASESPYYYNAWFISTPNGTLRTSLWNFISQSGSGFSVTDNGFTLNVGYSGKSFVWYAIGI